MNESNSCLVYLGLGANLGDPIEQLITARSLLLALPNVITGRCSSFYSSSPVGYNDQPEFVNCVLELEVTMSAVELLNHTQSIENLLGRIRVSTNQNAPRVIDIDVLLFGDHHIQSEHLTVPHPRMDERLFVLKPLLELLHSDVYQAHLDNGEFAGQELTQLLIKSDNKASTSL